MDRRIADPELAAGHHLLALRRCLHLFVAVGTILVVLACTAQVTQLSVAPASTLSLAMTLDYDLAQAHGTQVYVTVTLVSNESPHAIAHFSGGQYLMVNGVRLSENSSSHGVSHVAVIPRQPPGGRYTMVYTDEHGTHTSVDIPAPQADLAVIEPAPGANVPIPQRETSAIPTPTPMPTPTVVPSRTPDNAHVPLVVRYAVPYSPGSLPTSPLNHTPNDSAAFTVRGAVLGACSPLKQGDCPSVPSISASSDEATGTLTFRDWYLEYGRGFESIEPGPGSIRLDATVRWYVPHSGFGSLQLTYVDAVDSPITWVRA